MASGANNNTNDIEVSSGSSICKGTNKRGDTITVTVYQDGQDEEGPYKYSFSGTVRMEGVEIKFGVYGKQLSP